MQRSPAPHSASTPVASSRTRTSRTSLCEERLSVPDFDARGQVPARAPTLPPLNEATKAKRVMKRFDTVPPDGEGAAVQAWLALPREQALESLVAAFPGNRWFDWTLPHSRPAQGKDASPLCRALYSLGANAVPSVVRLMRSERPDQRYYASLLACDLAEPALLDALVERVFDDQSAVRQAAVVALCRWPDPAVVRSKLQPLHQQILVIRQPREHRRAILEALLALRDPGCVDALVACLDPYDASFADKAHRSLRQLTGHDFGRDPHAWRKWIRKNAKLSRRRWLAEALRQEDAELRTVAYQELCMEGMAPTLFDPSASPKDRKKSLKPVRKWVDAKV